MTGLLALDEPAARLRAAHRRRVATRWAGIVLAGAAVAVPALVNRYLVTIAATALIMALLAMSTQLLVGVAGLPAFGQPAYLGVGAYTAALIGNTGQTLAPLQLAAAATAGGVAAALTAPLLLRTRGTNFLLATFAVQSLAATAAAQWTAVTGGDEGLHTAAVVLWPGTTAVTDPASLYWYVLAAFTGCAVLLAALQSTRLTLTLRGIAGHEARMTALGHRVTAELAAGYTIAGTVAGAAGALLVAVNRYISPADLGFDVAALTLLAAAIGAGSLAGAAAGAVLIVAVRDGIGINTDGHAPLLLGLLFLTIAYLPAARTAFTPAMSRRRP
jgi:branched-chain amino acid transport system permease protein